VKNELESIFGGSRVWEAPLGATGPFG
jgi:hypothetical protein